MTESCGNTHDGKVVLSGDKLTTTCDVSGKQHCHTVAKGRQGDLRW